MTSDHAAAPRRDDASRSGRIVVGFDGSPNSERALAWATYEADVRGAELAVVTTTSSSDPRETLLAEASDAHLLVLSIDERGTGSRALLGSVASTASRTSPCPVVVVRGEWRPVTTRIVVGTDMSSASQAGLYLAADSAMRHGAELLVVHVREPRASRSEAECSVNRAANECRDRGATRVTAVVADGSPANVLNEMSCEADLMVIGSRGRSGFKTLLFGSVAENLVDRAHCPVLVTHPKLRMPPASALREPRS